MSLRKTSKSNTISYSLDRNLLVIGKDNGIKRGVDRIVCMYEVGVEPE